MFPCVCSVTDYRWRQNVVKQWSGARAARECVTDVCHILTSSVIYYWTNPRQRGIYLFYTMIRKVQTPIHIPASYRLTVRGFVQVKAFFLIPNATFRLGFFFPSLSYLYTVLGKVWTSSLAQSSKFVSFCRSDGWWWQLLWTFLAV